MNHIRLFLLPTAESAAACRGVQATQMAFGQPYPNAAAPENRQGQAPMKYHSTFTNTFQKIPPNNIKINEMSDPDIRADNCRSFY
ncbi:hypothetical protein [Pseudoruegeria sp. HB172150]|uniref:hypothetical protein n=1 Tax=Pseudoruegeria sp. HB172150 TaxID=2721164 RepID=UPI001557C742|nr:hypothetical protein [Pseudoruegeria sp. HB172150]